MRYVTYFIILILTACGSEAPPVEVKAAPVEAKKDFRKDAIMASRTCVRQMLKSPSSAKFPVSDEAQVAQIDDTTYRVVHVVNAQNAFGVMLQSAYSCNIVFSSDGQTRCFDIAIDGL